MAHNHVDHLKDAGSKAQVVGAGAFAGLVSRFIIAPLDVIKIRLQLQAQPPKLPAYHPHTLHTLTTICRTEGIRALWKGNIPAEALYVTYAAIQFSTYRFITATLSPLSFPQSTQSFISGAAAGATSTSLTYPLDLLRTRFAAQGKLRVYDGLAASVRTIIRDEGPRGFFRGLSAAVVQIVPYMGIFFALYESLHPMTTSVSLPFGSADAVVGVLSSVLSKTAVFPLDLVRKRLQIQGPTRTLYAHGGESPAYQGIMNTMAQILKREGVRGLYRGLSVGLIKAAPASAVTMWTYERALVFLLDKEKKEKVERGEHYA